MLTKLNITQILESCAVGALNRRESQTWQSHLAVDWGCSVEADKVKDCSHKGGHARE